MRRAASIVLGLLLATGSTLSAQGHVHTAVPDDQSSGVLHVDHFHLDSGNGPHPTVPGSPPELAADHPGEDAVDLSFSSTEAVPKRQVPGLALPAVPGGPPQTTVARTYNDPEAQPPLPSRISRPPGRAPPA